MVEKTAASAPAGEPVSGDTSGAAPSRVSLSQFCRDLSTTDKRVELIGGFHHTEKAAGRVRDTKEAYTERFGAFATATPK